jgi:hypothetical protein
MLIRRPFFTRCRQRYLFFHPVQFQEARYDVQHCKRKMAAYSAIVVLLTAQQIGLRRLPPKAPLPPASIRCRKEDHIARVHQYRPAGGGFAWTEVARRQQHEARAMAGPHQTSSTVDPVVLRAARSACALAASLKG